MEKKLHWECCNCHKQLTGGLWSFSRTDSFGQTRRFCRKCWASLGYETEEEI